MVALAEEEGVTGTVGDVRQANAAVKPEDAVPADAGKIRQTARKNRPFAGVPAITAQRIEAPGPTVGPYNNTRVFRHGVRQPIRRAEQELDDLGLRGIPPPRDIVAVIVVVPLLSQVVLFEVGKQFDPEGAASGRTVAHKVGKVAPRGELLV